AAAGRSRPAALDRIDGDRDSQGGVAWGRATMDGAVNRHAALTVPGTNGAFGGYQREPQPAKREQQNQHTSPADALAKAWQHKDAANQRQQQPRAGWSTGKRGGCQDAQQPRKR